MSYQAISELTYDPAFTSRIRACVVEQSLTFQNDQRQDVVALAKDVLQGGASGPMLSFNQVTAAAPGVADKATVADGTVDQSLVPDGDILASVQGSYLSVAALFYAADGTPLP
jgi:hypothetical protein